MKSCPCCKSLLFDDMSKCYDCMYPVKTAESSRDANEECSNEKLLEKLGSISDFSVDMSSSCAMSAMDDFVITPKDSSDKPTFPKAWRLYVGQSRGNLLEKTDYYISEKGPQLFIGRQGDNDIILNDPRVSRKHAKIFPSKGGLWIKDLGSKNLTYVEGKPVVGSAKIDVGSKVTIGSFVIEIHDIAKENI